MAPGASQTAFWTTFCRFGLYFRSIVVYFRRKTAIIPPALYSRSSYHSAANGPKPAKNAHNPPCFVTSFRHPFCGKLAKPLTAPLPSGPHVARRSLRSKLNPPRCSAAAGRREGIRPDRDHAKRLCPRCAPCPACSAWLACM